MTRLFETNRNKIFEYHIAQLCAITKNTKKTHNMFSYLMNLLFLIYFCYLIIYKAIKIGNVYDKISCHTLRMPKCL